MLTARSMGTWIGCLVLGLLQMLCHVAPSVAATVNGVESPIIGVLAQELYPDNVVAKHFNATSYISASYAKFVEGAGGRVVPISIGRNRSYYEQLLYNLNGLLLPGGGTFFNNTNGYGDAGEHLIAVAKEINDKGTYFPIWGTCLGMELLVFKMANGTESRRNCESISQALPLEFSSEYALSRMFADANDQVIDALTNENITYNYHRYCYTEKSFENPGFKDTWRIMSLNHDLNGYEFVSSIEHLKYPFYGVQFHPEKPLYEFVNKNVPHTASAVMTSQFFADFFISEARRNNHTFANATDLANALIYNYKPEYTALIGSSYMQQYLFSNSTDNGRNGGGSVLHVSALGLVGASAIAVLHLVIGF